MQLAFVLPRKNRADLDPLRRRPIASGEPRQFLTESWGHSAESLLLQAM